MMDARNHARHAAVHGYCAEIGYEPNGRHASPWLDKAEKFNALPENERTRRLAAAYEAIVASAEWQTFEHAYQEADRLYSIFVDRVLDRLDRGDDLVAGGRERA